MVEDFPCTFIWVCPVDKVITPLGDGRFGAANIKLDDFSVLGQRVDDAAALRRIGNDGVCAVGMLEPGKRGNRIFGLKFIVFEDKVIFVFQTMFGQIIDSQASRSLQPFADGAVPSAQRQDDADCHLRFGSNGFHRFLLFEGDKTTCRKSRYYNCQYDGGD